MDKLFVDTSGWIALINRSDALHTAAKKVYESRLAAGWNLVTHTGVMMETGNGLSLVKLRTLAVQLKQRLEASSRIEIVSVSDSLYEAGWRLYDQRPDKE